MDLRLTKELYDEIIDDDFGVGVFDANGLLQSHSPSLHVFLLDPARKQIANQSLSILLPELVGSEHILETVRKEPGADVFIERIFRPNLNGKPGYVSLRVKGYQGGWLVILRNTTTAGEMEQRITQQRNELSLLSDELEKTRAKIDGLLRTFVPTAVVDDLLKKDKTQPGGENRLVTILFADLRGYTAWAEKHSPEDAILGLNQLLTCAFEILNENGATINQLMGDGFMSIFNAPLAQPKHASHALKSALQIASLPGFSETVRFGVGVNTGFAMVGNVGSTRAMDYSAIGTTTNIAYRLQQLAGPGNALFGAKTLELTKGEFKYDFHGEFEVKGIRNPIPVYRLLE